jgi:hypothetical protein
VESANDRAAILCRMYPSGCRDIVQQGLWLVGEGLKEFCVLRQLSISRARPGCGHIPNNSGSWLLVQNCLHAWPRYSERWNRPISLTPVPTFISSATSSHLIPPHPIPLHPIPSRLIHPIPPHPSHPASSHLIPPHPASSHPAS